VVGILLNKMRGYMIRKIIKYPNSKLRLISEPVQKVDKSIRRLIRDMVSSMIKGHGIGLAAPQVGVAKRIIVLSSTLARISIINPEIVERGGDSLLEEGCLSLPKVLKIKRRSNKVKVIGLDIYGKDFSIDAEGLFARVLQHEIDHLDGILIIDKGEKYGIK